MARPNKYAGTDTPAGRLIAAREAAGFTRARDAAKAHGWSPSTYAQHECAASKYDRVADDYAAAFNVDPAWLLHGTRGKPPATVTRAASTPSEVVIVSKNPAGVVTIPELPTTVGAQAAAPLPFSADHLAAAGFDLTNVRYHVIEPDLATSDFHAGDTILVNTADRDATHPGPFIVRSATGRIAILHLQFMIGTEPPRVHVSVKGANPHTYDVPMQDLPILGRIVWFGRPLVR